MIAGDAHSGSASLKPLSNTGKVMRPKAEIPNAVKRHASLCRAARLRQLTAGRRIAIGFAEPHEQQERLPSECLNPAIEVSSKISRTRRREPSRWPRMYATGQHAVLAGSFNCSSSIFVYSSGMTRSRAESTHQRRRESSVCPDDRDHAISAAIWRSASDLFGCKVSRYASNQVDALGRFWLRA